MSVELKPCPFCGGQAVYDKVNLYLDAGWRVKCTKCTLQTMYVIVNHPYLTSNGLDESTRYTTEQAKQMVADVWNRRVGEQS